MARLRYTFVIPVLAAGLVGGFIGWTVTRVGCIGNSCSPVTSMAIGLVSGMVAAAGVGIVVVLTDRSLREWREWQDSGQSGAEGDVSPRRDTSTGEE